MYCACDSVIGVSLPNVRYVVSHAIDQILTTVTYHWNDTRCSDPPVLAYIFSSEKIFVSILQSYIISATRYSTRLATICHDSAWFLTMTETRAANH